MKGIRVFILLCVAAIFVACDRENERFVNQNIPSELCGTWYQVEKGASYFQYLTINTDGTMSASYHHSYGTTRELRGKCYYRNGEMRFYNDDWSKIYNGDDVEAFTIIEWSSSNLTLGYFKASFFMRTKDEVPDFMDERDLDLVGTWKYYQTETATATMSLKQNGSGNYEFSSPVMYENKDVINWFTRNNWFYRKYEGDTDYTLYRYNKSGDILYLYYCDILQEVIGNSRYDYHKQ